MYHIDVYLLTLGVTANGTMAWPNGLLQRAMDDLESWLRAAPTVMQFMGPWAVSLSQWPLGYGLGPSWMGYDVWTQYDGPSYWTCWIIDVARSQLTCPRVERSLRFLTPTFLCLCFLSIYFEACKYLNVVWPKTLRRVTMFYCYVLFPQLAYGLNWIFLF